MINGINEEGIDKLIYDIYNCNENIHKELENIIDNIDKIDYIFKAELANKIKYKFDYNKFKIQNSFNKIEYYIDLLLKVKMKYQNLNISIINKLKNDEIKEEKNEY